MYNELCAKASRRFHKVDCQNCFANSKPQWMLDDTVILLNVIVTAAVAVGHITQCLSFVVDDRWLPRDIWHDGGTVCIVTEATPVCVSGRPSLQSRGHLILVSPLRCVPWDRRRAGFGSTP